MSEVLTRKGVVKWFDAVKRFGFVTVGDPPEDAMLHVSCLQAFRANAVVKDAKVECVIERGPKGWQVKTLLSLEQPTAEEILAQYVPAKVKWFNALRGYGFVTRGPDTPDVFLHAEVVKDAQLPELQPNQDVLVLVEDGPKGPKASNVRAV